MRRRLRAIVVVAGSVALTVPAPALANNQLEYGKHLSGECTTCHKLDGSGGQQIPPITGWTPAEFVSIMTLYKNGLRVNPAMESVAKSLDDEQMQALAAYFGSLPKGKK
ncbi:MAG: c-type cytochrome [Hyphomicrobiaceae bacterium]|nr:MAG: c-type cytochrome [Hyphomicrobiaceae bacterium]